MSAPVSSPRPWRIEGQTIRDAAGAVVVSALNPCDMPTRRLIVDAVNGAGDTPGNALAAPARNCDRFTDPVEAAHAYADMIRSVGRMTPNAFVVVPGGAFAWLFAPAEGGGAE